MKSLFVTISILGLVGMMVAGLTQADTETTVTATVTVQNIAISVNDGTIAYGTLEANSSQNTLPGGVDDMQTATNDGNVTSDISIKGTDSADWTLAVAVDSDQYTHHFCNDTDNDCSSPPTSYTALTTDYATLKASVAASSTVDFQLQINTPNPSTVFTQQNVNVSVQASAS